MVYLIEEEDHVSLLGILEQRIQVLLRFPYICSGGFSVRPKSTRPPSLRPLLTLVDGLGEVELADGLAQLVRQHLEGSGSNK
jgi:hypothetical protein